MPASTSDGRDAATGACRSDGAAARGRPTLPTNYTQFVNRNGLAGARIGVTRQGIDGISAFTGAVFDHALDAMEAAGATLVDLDEAGFTFPPGDGEFLVLLFEFVERPAALPGDARRRPGRPARRWPM